MQKINQILTRFTRDPKFQADYKATVDYVLNHPDVKAFVDQYEDAISQEMIENSLSKLNEFAREMDLIRRGEQGQNPGFKPVLFLNYNYIDVSYVPTKAYYDNKEKQQQRSLLDNRMMSADVREASLTEYYANTESRKQLLAEVISFLDEYKKNPHRAQGLYISGEFGVGKTYLLGALANALVKLNKSVTMIHYPTFTTEIKSTFADNSTQQVLTDVKSVDILIIDDIGAEANTVWVRDEVLTTILEYRMKESLPTFFSSNFNLKEIESHLAHSRDGGNETIKAKRIMERIRYLAKEVSLTGENLRHRNR
ncbi:primosomal protein DnaI [Aerococcaceae bacterium INB8]|uniref:Primosomal protein DnaI n=1 Tax=Ruoffia halotolerans TaxID=2748684 RepID=A0A839A3U0_9LACT|nr:primosomal protein DnaI [Ruoffia halotolerans]MBA5728458.1 primosomal protein DnaI [Ruoffia halotolerans]